MTQASSLVAPALLIEDGRCQHQLETLAQETPVALVYNGQSHAVMMATPADLEDFAVGFSLTEGIVEAMDEVRIIDIMESDGGISIQMWIPQSRFDAVSEHSRNLSGRTGCGLCGSDSLARAIRPVRRVGSAHGVDADALRAGFARLEAAQPLNSATGAVHAAAIVCADGSLPVREDVGRHNAIDKVVGCVVRNGRVPRALLVTSRASYEVVHKAAQMGIGVVAAISAPTALAVRIAAEAGVTLVGFARGHRLTVYAGAIATVNPTA